MYLTAVHEIGHMLGLRHNPNPSSVMYYIDLEGSEVLDSCDLTSLAAHHKLRIDLARAPIPVNAKSIRR
jgi:predicted Zn-dependent protease